MYLPSMIIDTVNLIAVVSLPFLVATTVIGLLIALIQTLTQVQEQTLPQIAKIIFVIVVGLLSMTAIGTTFADHMVKVLDMVAFV